MKELLAKLVEASGIPGAEDSVREVIKKELQGHVSEMFTDNLGNLITKKIGTLGRPTVMFAAHMDEVGLMVKYIDEKGFIKFAKVGGVVDQLLLSQRVKIHTEKGIASGIIGAKPPHLMKEEERKKIVEFEDMFIDVGANSREDVEKLGVKVGNPITFERNLVELRNKLVTGKALDDRAGCAILIETIKRLPKTEATVYAVFTVQEEIGLRGATVSAFKLNPNLAIALDITSAGDYPGIKEFESPIKIGHGPAIKIVDGRKESLGGGLVAHPKVRELLIKAAEKEKIPYQLEVMEGGTTDATAIQLSREGIPAGVISIPTRYAHSPVEVISLEDAENAVKICLNAVQLAPRFFGL